MLEWLVYMLLTSLEASVSVTEMFVLAISFYLFSNRVGSYRFWEYANMANMYLCQTVFCYE